MEGGVIWRGLGSCAEWLLRVVSDAEGTEH